MAEVVMVGEKVAGRAAHVRRNLMAMVSNLSTNTFDLALLLHEARENNYPTAWGFSSLAEYAEKELGLKKRKAEYLTRIVKVMQAVGLKREQYEAAGTSKLREITRLDPEGSFWNKEEHVSEPFVDYIVQLTLDHDKMNVQQTKDEVARLLGQTGPDRRVMRSFSTDQSTWDNVMKPALETARRMLGSQGRDESGDAKEYPDGVCWEVIAAAFNADPNNGPEPEELPAEEKDMQDYVKSELPMEGYEL
jgi:hypothetical protein